MKTDLKNITKEMENKRLIIFAGDFNSDKNRDSINRKYFEFLEELGFENITNGDEFVNTMVPEVRPYPNDKVFIRNVHGKFIKNINCKKIIDTKLDISDHYPILIEIPRSNEIEINGIVYSKNDFPEWYKNIEKIRKDYLRHY